jgi:Flp pilus assembly protein TadD
MSDPEQLTGEADIAFRAGKLAEARELYEAALSLVPDWVAVHNNLAMVLRNWVIGEALNVIFVAP